MHASLPIANLLVLRSPDIHRAVPFYQALGLRFTLERHGSGPEHYASWSHGFVFELYPVGPGQGPTTNIRIGFHVDSVDTLVPSLCDLGASLVDGPKDSGWGRRAVMRDLDGNTVEIIATKERLQHQSPQ
ncbi:VOC family protein [Tuwongella immobilis]|uniref:VOC family protein n=1 Tax=Tuwongella immobilis TaxID=692036 RepID=UPI0013A6FD7A|nr:VOC family protein [Tuwongella immobilis]